MKQKIILHHGMRVRHIVYANKYGIILIEPRNGKTIGIKWDGNHHISRVYLNEIEVCDAP